MRCRSGPPPTRCKCTIARARPNIAWRTSRNSSIKRGRSWRPRRRKSSRGVFDYVSPNLSLCFSVNTSSVPEAMSQTVVLKVGMSCQGCVGAVKRVLTKMEGVESFDVDIEQQKVTVKGNVPPEAVLQTVSKTGKKTSFWEEAKPAEPAAPTEAGGETVAAAV